MLTVNFRDFPLASGDRVLDLGCGEGRHLLGAYLHQDITAVGIDLNHHDLQQAYIGFLPFKSDSANKHFYLQRADGAQLPFADRSFDKVICSEVLEHIENYSAILLEIKRVLKPGGLLAISVPRAWPEKMCWWLSKEYHQVAGGHIRIFNGRKLQQEIENVSFCFRSRHWAHALHAPYWWLRCICWHSQEKSRLVKLYHRLLVWDLMSKPWITQTLERILNPILGKSLVMYFEKLEQ